MPPPTGPRAGSPTAWGDLPAAVDAYQRTLEHDDRNQVVRVGLGKLQLELERWEEARTTLEAAVQGPQPMPDAHVALARAPA